VRDAEDFTDAVAVGAFAEGGGGDLSGVLDAVHVEEGDAARASGHGGKIAYSLFVRHEKAVSGDG